MLPFIAYMDPMGISAWFSKNICGSLWFHAARSHPHPTSAHWMCLQLTPHRKFQIHSILYKGTVSIKGHQKRSQGDMRMFSSLWWKVLPKIFKIQHFCLETSYSFRILSLHIVYFKCWRNSYSYVCSITTHLDWQQSVQNHLYKYGHKVKSSVMATY